MREVDEETELEGIVITVTGHDEQTIYMMSPHGKTYAIAAMPDQIAALPADCMQHPILLHVTYKYNVKTGACYRYRMLSVVDTTPVGKEVMQAIVDRESKNWRGVTDPQKWLLNFRGE